MRHIISAYIIGIFLIRLSIHTDKIPTSGDPAWLWLAILSFGVGTVLLGDWTAEQLTVHLREFYRARTYGVREFAAAIRGVSDRGLELIAAHTLTELELITGPGEEPTIVTLRCVGGSIPVGFIGDYLKASEPSWPYLLPIRDAKKITQLVEDWRHAGGIEILAKKLTDKLSWTGWPTVTEAITPPGSKKISIRSNLYRENTMSMIKKIRYRLALLFANRAIESQRNALYYYSNFPPGSDLWKLGEFSEAVGNLWMAVCEAIAWDQFPNDQDN